MQSMFDASGGPRRMRVLDDHGEGGEERGHREAHTAISFKQDDPATQRTRAEPVLQPGLSANVSCALKRTKSCSPDCRTALGLGCTSQRELRALHA